MFQNEEREKERRRQAEQQEANGLKTDANQEEEEEDDGGKQPGDTRQTPDSGVSGDFILLKKELFKGLRCLIGSLQTASSALNLPDTKTD